MVRVYRSTARRPLGDEDLQNIVDVARRNNAAARVSGMLLFGEGRFLQLLEGPGPAVERIYRRVLSDARHRDAILVYDGKGEPLRFTEWPMAFVRSECVTHLRSVTRLMQQGDEDGVERLGAQAALQLFLDLRREICLQASAPA